MIRPAALRETVTLYTRAASGGVGRYGDALRDETAHEGVRAAVSALEAAEDEQLRDTRLQRYRALLAPDAPVDGLSRIEWRGRSMEVLGEPLLVTTRQGPHHLELVMREVRG